MVWNNAKKGGCCTEIVVELLLAVLQNCVVFALYGSVLAMNDWERRAVSSFKEEAPQHGSTSSGSKSGEPK